MKWAAQGCLLLGSCASVYGAEVCVRPPAIEKSLRLKPSAEAYTALGVWFARQKQFACAFPAFEDSLHLSPDSWLTHYDYALALAAAGHRDRANAELRKATTLNPEFLAGHLALGEALEDQGLLEQAGGGGDARAWLTAVQRAPRIWGKTAWITPAISCSERRAAASRGGGGGGGGRAGG